MNINKLNDNINILDSQTLIYYEKLKTENKEFIIDTIKHLYNMQKRDNCHILNIGQKENAPSVLFDKDYISIL